MRPAPRRAALAAHESSRMPRLWLAAVALVAALGYLNALRNGFAVDDRGVILENPAAQSLGGVIGAFGRPYWPDAHAAGQYRPLTSAHFAIDWVLSGGSPRWFHAVNVVWHAAASVMVALVAGVVASPAAALAGGLLFALHPVHVEAVANVVGRAESMAAVFVLIALLAHRRRHLGAAAAFAAAILSKESGIVFIALAVVHDLLLADAPGQAPRVRKRLYVAYGVVLAGYAAALAAIFRGRPFVAAAPTWFGATTGQRLLTMAAVVPEYLRLLVLPARLAIDYHPRVIELATSVTPAAVAGALLTVLFAAVVARSWHASPPVAFALLVFPIAIAPVANVFFPSGVVLAERTLYLPSVSVALLGALAVDRWGRARPRATVGVVAVICLLFAVRGWTRTPIWHDNRTLVVTALAEEPQSYKVHEVAARVLAHIGDFDGAQREYRVASSLFAHDPFLYREAAEVALVRRDPGLATALLDTALALAPGDSGARARRASLLAGPRPDAGSRTVQ